MKRLITVVCEWCQLVHRWTRAFWLGLLYLWFWNCSSVNEPLAFTCPHLSSSSANWPNMPFMKNVIPILDRNLPFHRDVFVFILLQREHSSGVELHVYLSCTFLYFQFWCVTKAWFTVFFVLLVFLSILETREHFYSVTYKTFSKHHASFSLPP